MNRENPNVYLGGGVLLTIVALIAWWGGYVADGYTVIGMAVAATLGLFFFAINTSGNKWLWGVVVAMFAFYLAPFPYHFFRTTLPVLYQETGEAVGRLEDSAAKSLAHDSAEARRKQQCQQVRDADKGDIAQKLATNTQWRVDNARWLAAGSALAQQYLAQYESGQAGLNAKLRVADAEYERCVGGFAKAPAGTASTPGSSGGSGFSLPATGIVHAILYEWHWAISFLLVPFVFGFGSRIVLGPEFIKSSRAKAVGSVLAVGWFVVLMCLRAP